MIKRILLPLIVFLFLIPPSFCLSSEGYVYNDGDSEHIPYMTPTIIYNNETWRLGCVWLSDSAENRYQCWYFKSPQTVNYFVDHNILYLVSYYERNIPRHVVYYNSPDSNSYKGNNTQFFNVPITIDQSAQEWGFDVPLYVLYMGENNIINNVSLNQFKVPIEQIYDYFSEQRKIPQYIDRLEYINEQWVYVTTCKNVIDNSEVKTNIKWITFSPDKLLDIIYPYISLEYMVYNNFEEYIQGKYPIGTSSLDYQVTLNTPDINIFTKNVTTYVSSDLTIRHYLSIEDLVLDSLYDQYISDIVTEYEGMLFNNQSVSDILKICANWFMMPYSIKYDFNNDNEYEYELIYNNKSNNIIGAYGFNYENHDIDYYIPMDNIELDNTTPDTWFNNLSDVFTDGIKTASNTISDFLNVIPNKYIVFVFLVIAISLLAYFIGKVI